MASGERLLDRGKRVRQSLAVAAGALSMYEPVLGRELDEVRVVGVEPPHERDCVPAFLDVDLDGGGRSPPKAVPLRSWRTTRSWLHRITVYLPHATVLAHV